MVLKHQVLTAYKFGVSMAEGASLVREETSFLRVSYTLPHTKTINNVNQ